ncbi:MAG TPA: hypothetical protein VL486_07485 [Verrucomicrobiae bacterium]|nr:hypothetical protein [Verrucomicrobiae bacterium]
MNINRLDLREPQRRSISITLADIESRLLQLRHVFHCPPTEGVLTRHSEPLPREQAHLVDDLISKIQAKMQILGDRLDLEPQQEPQLRSALAALVLANVSIEEIKPRYLRGYGAVDPATTEFLNAELPQLQSLLSELTGLLDRKGFVGRGHSKHEHSSSTK